MPLADLARSLLDTPRWIETRFMLLRGEAEVTGLSADRRRFVAVSTRWPLASVVGRPDPAFIAGAGLRSRPEVTLLCAEEDGDHVAGALPGWKRVGAAIHSWPHARPLPGIPAADSARLLAPGEAGTLPHLPDVIRAEIATAFDYSPVAAGLAGGLPVAFCYATGITESLWDVSIDTLEEHRRHGHAARAFALMAATMARLGKSPVWGAADDNMASRALAAWLGFVPAERLAMFERS